MHVYNFLHIDMSEEDDKKQVVAINTSGSNFLMHHEGMSNAKILKIREAQGTHLSIYDVLILLN